MKTNNKVVTEITEAIKPLMREIELLIMKVYLKGQRDMLETIDAQRKGGRV